MTDTIRFTKTIHTYQRFLNDSELSIHEEIARAKEERTTITLSTGRVSCQSGFIPMRHNEMFAPIEEMKARIREAGGWDAYWAKNNTDATDNFLASALGFEPTEHSDAPPYIPTTPTAKPKPCVDFGFEPTEASE